jgi:hypothetical protein
MKQDFKKWLNVQITNDEFEHTKTMLCETMHSFITELKSKWNPKTETIKGTCYHGSKKGDEIEYTLYFDEYRCEWTNKDRAFKGYIFKHINTLIENCTNMP